ncbi:hypothetical protein ACTFIY_011107 [Dictyostelium cf. discoideum]
MSKLVSQWLNETFKVIRKSQIIKYRVQFFKNADEESIHEFFGQPPDQLIKSKTGTITLLTEDLDTVKFASSCFGEVEVENSTKISFPIKLKQLESLDYFDAMPEELSSKVIERRTFPKEISFTFVNLDEKWDTYQLTKTIENLDFPKKKLLQTFYDLHGHEQEQEQEQETNWATTTTTRVTRGKTTQKQHQL